MSCSWYRMVSLTVSLPVKPEITETFALFHEQFVGIATRSIETSRNAGGSGAAMHAGSSIKLGSLGGHETDRHRPCGIRLAALTAHGECHGTQGQEEDCDRNTGASGVRFGRETAAEMTAAASAYPASERRGWTRPQTLWWRPGGHRHDGRAWSHHLDLARLLRGTSPLPMRRAESGKRHWRHA
jgi:hypothetical protein